MNYQTLALDVCIRGALDKDDIWMRCIKMVPFIPYNGVTLELWHDDSTQPEQTHKITLQSVFYSFEHSMFIEEQMDEDLLESARAGDLIYSDKQKLIEWYEAFGFKRFSFNSVEGKP